MATEAKWSRRLARFGNTSVCFLVGTVGINLQGARVLAVRGRKSGALHKVPVNPLVIDGKTYLLSPRGNTQWVRNLRAAGSGNLGFRRKHHAFTVVRELSDHEKPEIIAAYLNRWHLQVGKLMQVEKHPDASTLARIAPKHPVFEITTPARDT